MRTQKIGNATFIVNHSFNETKNIKTIIKENVVNNKVIDNVLTNILNISYNNIDANQCALYNEGEI